MRLPRAALPLLLVVPALAGAFAPAPADAARLAVARDVRVPTIRDASVRADIWRMRDVSRAARPRPVALLVHGGGWHTGDKRQWEHSRWAQRLTRRGWVVVNANYRLACTPPDTARASRDPRLCGHAMRTSIADVRASLRYASSHARRWGGDPDRIVLFGASAGAQLAMLAGSDPRRPAGVRAVVAISPPTDLAWIGARQELPIHPSAALSIGCPRDACPAAWRRASPIAMIRRGTTPPTWLFDAAADPITPMAPVRAYAQRLRANRIPAALVTSADPTERCHGPLPCAGTALAGTDARLFEQAQAWLRPRIR